MAFVAGSTKSSFTTLITPEEAVLSVTDSVQTKPSQCHATRIARYFFTDAFAERPKERELCFKFLSRQVILVDSKYGFKLVFTLARPQAISDWHNKRRFPHFSSRFRQVYYEALDFVAQAVSDRFYQPGYRVHHSLQELFLGRVGGSTSKRTWSSRMHA